MTGTLFNCNRENVEMQLNTSPLTSDYREKRTSLDFLGNGKIKEEMKNIKMLYGDRPNPLHFLALSVV